MKQVSLLFTLLFFSITLVAQNEGQWEGKFEQLDHELPTPNVYRAGDGAPGPDYWQQRADYKIDVRLDDENQRVSGQATITYYNQSPQALSYLWLQLDQNRRAADNEEALTNSFVLPERLPTVGWMYFMNKRTREGGMHIESLTDEKGQALAYHIQKTMMRIDLPKALESKGKVSFKIKWWYNLNNRMEDYGRSGFEYFPEDGNYVYTVAQFYPRMAVYDDLEGWQHKQFLGAGEFALTFGNYEVNITVPDDHLLTATGELENAKEVLSKKHYQQFQKALKSDKELVIIANQDEAILREQQKSKKYQTWKFKAENVRDFAFASSRKFIWDAQIVKIGQKNVLAQSFYPKEGNPLWEEESTKAVINTLKTYSKYTIPYPYPVATSVHAAAIGMEYPMICFNFGRPNADGSYTDAIKYNMIGVIVHEVGHNFFPMIVNSDERQWTWMDEGLNSFLEYLTEQECYENFPSERGPATSIISYMQGDKSFIRPIMTNSEQVIQLGDNAYGKPAAALNILRETVMGRAAFDKAFKTYAQRWAFKHPKPADFFRSMEDASGIDLDWFWKGWFYSIDHVDISLDSVFWYQLDTPDDPVADQGETEIENNLERSKPFFLLDSPDAYYWEFKDRLDDAAIRKDLVGKHIYQLHFSNVGGLVMPIVLEFQFESGEKEIIRIPAEVWRKNENEAAKVFVFDKKVSAVQLDPMLETADIDTNNNRYPREKAMSRLEKFKQSNK